jgi:hypothetical protein
MAATLLNHLEPAHSIGQRMECAQGCSQSEVDLWVLAEPAAMAQPQSFLLSTHRSSASAAACH